MGRGRSGSRPSPPPRSSLRNAPRPVAASKPAPAAPRPAVASKPTLAQPPVSTPARTPAPTPATQSHAPTPATQSHAPTPATQSHAPAPVPASQPQAPMVQQPSSGGGLLGSLASTVAQGMAFGTGSAIAHRAVDSIMGPRGGGHDAAPAAEPVAAPAAAPLNSSVDHCANDFAAFEDCMKQHDSLSQCQFYYDVLQQCRRQA